MSDQFSAAEIDLLRQWFNAIEDVAPNYLEKADYALAEKVHGILGAPFRPSPKNKARLSLP